MARQPQIVRPKKFVWFHNWTAYPFTWSWDGTPWHFEAGEKMKMTDDLAEHFSVHLVEHYINESDTKDKNLRGVRSTQAFKDLVQKAIIPIEGAEVARTEGDIKRMELGMLSEIQPPNSDFDKSEEQLRKELQKENHIEPPKKKGRPKKVKEEVFEGLNS